MTDNLLKIGCLSGLLLAWGALVCIGRADAAPLVTFLQTTAYAMSGVVAHSLVTKGSQNAQTPSNPSSAFDDGLRNTAKPDGSADSASAGKPV